MPYQTITLSSVGTSVAANLNWRGGKASTILVYGSSSAAGDFFVQYTLDDIQLSSSPTWFGLSSNSYNVETGVAVHYTSSTIFPGSSQGETVYIPLPGPFGAVRINSTGLSTGTITMKVMQGEGW